MKGLMFHHVASRLYAELDKSNPSERFVRTIINRAYYAMLLVLRDGANLAGFGFGRGGHRRVLNQYRNAEGPGMAVVGDQFQYLMGLRLMADCGMDARLTVGHAEKSLDLCKDILESVFKAPRGAESQPKAAPVPAPACRKAGD